MQRFLIDMVSQILHTNQVEYLKTNKRKVDKLLQEIERFSSRNSIPILHWNAAELMEQLILTQSPKNVLEIGTAVGYSAIRIAKCLEENSRLDTIEISIENITIAETNIKKSGLSNKIKVLRGDALKILPTLNSHYDFIFLDSEKKDYKKLLDLSLVLLKPKGIILIDNLLWKGFVASKIVPEKYINTTDKLRKFNRYFLSEKKLISTILPVGDGIGFGIKK